MGSNDGLDCRETSDSIEGRVQVKSGTSPSLSFAAMRSGISGQSATRREKISCSMVVSIEALQVPPRTGKCLWDLRICCHTVFGKLRYKRWLRSLFKKQRTRYQRADNARRFLTIQSISDGPRSRRL
jgi:hypothetical protein